MKNNNNKTFIHRFRAEKNSRSKDSVTDTLSLSTSY